MGENCTFSRSRSFFSLWYFFFARSRASFSINISLYILWEQIFSIVMSKINDQTENYRKRNKEEWKLLKIFDVNHLAALFCCLSLNFFAINFNFLLLTMCELIWYPKCYPSYCPRNFFSRDNFFWLCDCWSW